MEYYYYQASEMDGTLVHGMLSAEDKKHLIALLQEKNLFLISCSTQKKPGPEPAAPRRLSWPQCALILCLLISVVSIGFFRAASRRQNESSAALVNAKLAQIHSGQTRLEVEKVFTVSLHGSDSPDKGRYFVPPNFVVEILYDPPVGPRIPQNQKMNAIYKISQVKDDLYQKHRLIPRS